ncbi:helix-turn-helix domain protein [Runella slithyformis DSM 19594]|uniref:Helix-turn-helix domain protein n=2 Tax=Runella TaxID=105 RepID=A0A7U3ZLZ3_RUNSL|nr:helix-turn-helix domain protein [Runella slithyformis DSM 19594]
MYIILYMDISNSIRKLRESKHLTQQEVADKLQIERSNYARFEARGKKLTIEQLENIAEALGVSIFEILMGKPQSAGHSDREIELEKENELLRKQVKDLEEQNKGHLNSLNIISQMFEGVKGYAEKNKDSLETMLSNDSVSSEAITSLSMGILGAMPNEVFNEKLKEDLKKRADEQMRELKRKK